MDYQIFIICTLFNFVNRFFDSFPREIIRLIMTIDLESVKIICGDYYTCILDQLTGKVYVCGSCGLGDKKYIGEKYSNKFQLVPLPKKIESVSCVDMYMIAFAKDVCYEWGLNPDTDELIGSPRELNFPFKELKYRSSHCLARDKNNSNVIVWGHNTHGQLGNGTYEDVEKDSPFKIPVNNVIGFDSGFAFTIILDINGCVFTCGRNNYGQLGLGLELSDQKINILTEIKIDKVIQIGCDSYFAVALTKSAQCYTWGHNGHGQLGLGDFLNRNKPCQVNHENIISVSCGSNYTTILDGKGDVYSWGFNFHGHLGLGHCNNINSPQKISIKHVIKSINCGIYHSVAITKNNSYYVWGRNDFGQLGLEHDYDYKNTPQLLELNLNLFHFLNEINLNLQ